MPRAWGEEADLPNGETLKQGVPATQGNLFGACILSQGRDKGPTDGPPGWSPTIALTRVLGLFDQQKSTRPEEKFR